MYLATGNKFILTTPVAQWLFHKPDPRGCVVPEVGVLFNQPYIPRGVVVTNTYGLRMLYRYCCCAICISTNQNSAPLHLDVKLHTTPVPLPAANNKWPEKVVLR